MRGGWLVEMGVRFTMTFQISKLIFPGRVPSLTLQKLPYLDFYCDTDNWMFLFSLLNAKPDFICKVFALADFLRSSVKFVYWHSPLSSISRGSRFQSPVIKFTVWEWSQRPIVAAPPPARQPMSRVSSYVWTCPLILSKHHRAMTPQPTMSPVHSPATPIHQHNRESAAIFASNFSLNQISHITSFIHFIGMKWMILNIWFNIRNKE